MNKSRLISKSLSTWALFLLIACVSNVASAATSIQAVSRWANSGGVGASVGLTTDKLNGELICPADPTPGRDSNTDLSYEVKK